jgi:hypothetical protein
MTAADIVELLQFARTKTIDLLDAVGKRPDAQAVLGWRPAPGRAPIAWQLMHIAATDDRHLYVRMKGGEPKEPEYVRRYAGGSTPDDNIPTIEEVRRYLADRRQEMLDHFRGLDNAALAARPNAQAPWTYQEWGRVLVWHESHHQGQAHLTFNLYQALNKVEK